MSSCVQLSNQAFMLLGEKSARVLTNSRPSVANQQETNHSVNAILNPNYQVTAMKQLTTLDSEIHKYTLLCANVEVH